MKQIIFRVDDRLIHGQVVEGWIKNFRILAVIIVNDRISASPMQQMIYQSVVPPRTEVTFYTIDKFVKEWEKFGKQKDSILVLFENIHDLIKCESALTRDVYINIGCVASRSHSIEISDTVFLEQEELDQLTILASKWQIHIKKLPWEKDAAFCRLD